MSRNRPASRGGPGSPSSPLRLGWFLGGLVLASTGTLVLAGMLVSVLRAYQPAPEGLLSGGFVPGPEWAPEQAVLLPAFAVIAVVTLAAWAAGFLLMRDSARAGTRVALILLPAAGLVTWAWLMGT